MAVRRSRWRVVTALIVILLMASSVIGFGARHTADESEPGLAPFGQTISFDLYTHCGISELKAFGRYFERIGGTLGDGFGNPPAGWGNPFQAGRLSVSGSIATFRDSHGHVEKFKVRPGATGFSMICS